MEHRDVYQCAARTTNLAADNAALAPANLRAGTAPVPQPTSTILESLSTSMALIFSSMWECNPGLARSLSFTDLTLGRTMI
jgi:hypothetical protein